MHQLQFVKFKNQGFIALLSVLIVAAVGLAISLSLLLINLNFSRSGFSLEQSSQAKALANACAEEALQKLRESVYYAGNETKNFSSGSCEIQTISGVGNFNRVVQTIGFAGEVQRKVKIVINSVHPVLIIFSWKEVADF